jgi:ABC-type Fe3+ transport system substrate-binding protein
MGYNLLASYAESRLARGAPLVIIYPEDYTLAVTRTAIVPKNAPHPRAANAFVEYLLSLRGQRILADRGRLGAVREEIEGPYSRMGITEATVGPLRPIELGPGLLVYLDAQKHRRLLKNWRAMVMTPHTGGPAAADSAVTAKLARVRQISRKDGHAGYEGG